MPIVTDEARLLQHGFQQLDDSTIQHLPTSESPWRFVLSNNPPVSIHPQLTPEQEKEL